MRNSFHALLLAAFCAAGALLPAAPARAQVAPALRTYAQPVPPQSALQHAVVASAGILSMPAGSSVLQLDAAAFDSDGVRLTLEAARRLAAAGHVLHRLGVDRLRVVIYPGLAVAAAEAPSRRAAAVARALARGGFPPGRIDLAVAPAAAPEASAAGGAAGRILAASRCLSGCSSPATLPR